MIRTFPYVVRHLERVIDPASVFSYRFIFLLTTIELQCFATFALWLLLHFVLFGGLFALVVFLGAFLGLILLQLRGTVRSPSTPISKPDNLLFVSLLVFLFFLRRRAFQVSFRIFLLSETLISPWKRREEVR